jgi:hypothetical protein
MEPARSKVTELASGAITATDYLVIELIEADETPAAVIVRWPLKPTVLHPQRFPPQPTPLLGSSPLRLSGWLRFDETGDCNRNQPIRAGRQGNPGLTPPPSDRPA